MTVHRIPKKKIKLENLGCTKTSSNCIIWQGPDIECLNLCKGDTITEVVYQLATSFCDLYQQLHPDSFNFECLDLGVCDIANFHDLFQGLINKVCNIVKKDCNLYTKITPIQGGFTVEIENGAAPYTYSWEIADTQGLFQLTGATNEETVVAEIRDLNESSFDACNSQNTGRIGLLKVKVTDVNGCIASDTYLMINIVCE